MTCATAYAESSNLLAEVGYVGTLYRHAGYQVA